MAGVAFLAWLVASAVALGASIARYLSQDRSLRTLVEQAVVEQKEDEVLVLVIDAHAITAGGGKAWPADVWQRRLAGVVAGTAGGVQSGRVVLLFCFELSDTWLKTMYRRTTDTTQHDPMASDADRAAALAADESFRLYKTTLAMLPSLQTAAGPTASPFVEVGIAYSGGFEYDFSFKLFASQARACARRRNWPTSAMRIAAVGRDDDLAFTSHDADFWAYWATSSFSIISLSSADKTTGMEVQPIMSGLGITDPYEGLVTLAARANDLVKHVSGKKQGAGAVHGITTADLLKEVISAAPRTLDDVLELPRIKKLKSNKLRPFLGTLLAAAHAPTLILSDKDEYEVKWERPPSAAARSILCTHGYGMVLQSFDSLFACSDKDLLRQLATGLAGIDVLSASSIYLLDSSQVSASASPTNSVLPEDLSTALQACYHPGSNPELMQARSLAALAKASPVPVLLESALGSISAAVQSEPRIAARFVDNELAGAQAALSDAGEPLLRVVSVKRALKPYGDYRATWYLTSLSAADADAWVDNEEAAERAAVSERVANRVNDIVEYLDEPRSHGSIAWPAGCCTQSTLCDSFIASPGGSINQLLHEMFSGGEFLGAFKPPALEPDTTLPVVFGDAPLVLFTAPFDQEITNKKGTYVKWMDAVWIASSESAALVAMSDQKARFDAWRATAAERADRSAASKKQRLQDLHNKAHKGSSATGQRSNSKGAQRLREQRAAKKAAAAATAAAAEESMSE